MYDKDKEISIGLIKQITNGASMISNFLLEGFKKYFS
jgi:hypothetical protein